jgi:hypothetical protein
LIQCVLVSVRIRQNENDKICGQGDPSARRERPYGGDRLLRRPIARQLSSGDNLFEPPDADDLEKAHRYLSKIGMVGIDGIKSVLPFTRLLFEHEFLVIRSIAEELLRRGQLSYD